MQTHLQSKIISRKEKRGRILTFWAQLDRGKEMKMAVRAHWTQTPQNNKTMFSLCFLIFCVDTLFAVHCTSIRSDLDQPSNQTDRQSCAKGERKQVKAVGKTETGEARAFCDSSHIIELYSILLSPVSHPISIEKQTFFRVGNSPPFFFSLWLYFLLSRITLFVSFAPA